MKYYLALSTPYLPLFYYIRQFAPKSFPRATPRCKGDSVASIPSPLCPAMGNFVAVPLQRSCPLAPPVLFRSFPYGKTSFIHRHSTPCKRDFRLGKRDRRVENGNSPSSLRRFFGNWRDPLRRSRPCEIERPIFWRRFLATSLSHFYLSPKLD